MRSGPWASWFSCATDEGSITFAQNPISINVDPEALLQRHRDGASNESLAGRREPMADIPDAHEVT